MTETMSSISNGDRLTSLHDSLLTHILSRLPIKDAVLTSILSKHWKRKWTLSYNVDTDLRIWGNQYTPWTFADFLDGILLSRKHLKRFRVTFFHGMSDSVQKWVNAALGHNLEYLDVNTNGNDLVFPGSLLNNTSLRELKVMQPFSSPVRVTVADKNCAPNLTTLSLCNVEFVHQNPESSSVLFEFPVLEALEYRQIRATFGYRKQTNIMEIYAPSLISFSFEPPMLWGRDLDCSIKIAAPRLTKLSCYVGLPDNIILDRSQIVSVFLSAWDDQQFVITTGMQAANLVNTFTNLEELTLSRCMAEVLRTGPPLHQNVKLKRLALLSGSNANQLFKLLHEIPSLKYISINVDKWEYYDYEAIDAPSCITSHLEEVVLQAFSSEVPQYNLAEFLLKAAKKLKKITITTNDIGSSEEMKKVLLAFDRCSSSLEICSRLPDIEYTSLTTLRMCNDSSWTWRILAE